MGFAGNSNGQTLNPQPIPCSSFNRIESHCTITSDVSSRVSENVYHFNYYENSNFNQTVPFDHESPPTCWEHINASSSAIETTDPFMTETDQIILKQEPHFEDEYDDDYDSNNESYELCEDKDCSADDDEHSLDSTRTCEIANYLEGYPCSWPGCGERLRDNTSLSCHMDRHRGTPKQKCEQCSQMFYSGGDLVNHQTMQHAKATNSFDRSSIKVFGDLDEEDSSHEYEMEETSSEESEDDDTGTNSKFVGKQINKYKDQKIGRKSKREFEYKFVRDPTTGKKSYICSWPGCGKSMSGHTNMLGHLDQHKGTPRWKCDLCPHQSYWRNVFVKHLRTNHGENSTKPDKPLILKTHQFSQDPISGKYACPEKTCSITYKNIRMIKDHFRHDHLLKKKNKQNLECENKETGTNSNKSKSFVCKQSKFDVQKSKHKLVRNLSSGKFETYKRVEHDVDSNCGRGLILKKHIFRQDLLTGKYTCPDKTCSVTYKHIRMIKDHYKTEHLKITGESGFVCEYDECSGKTYSKRSHLQAHMDKHKGTPKFKCEKCNLLFYWKPSLLNHQKKDACIRQSAE